MKGIVFTEFLEMVEEKFGYEMVDRIIEGSNLPSNGAYTAIGTYDHAEIVELLTNLSNFTDNQASFLLKEFGRYLFDTFLKNYPVFFDHCKNGFDFLASIDNHIHVEVRKLYPDASLPEFKSKILHNEMQLQYLSERKMGDLAEGLIEKTMEHFNHRYQLRKKLLKADGSVILFTIIAEN